MPSVVGLVAQERVAFVGPFGVGKTTAVRTISDVTVADTDVRRSASTDAEPADAAKRTTTVGIDYGEWHPVGRPRVAVYGTPGQLRFDMVRANAMSAGATLVLWLFGDRLDALDEAELWLRHLHTIDARAYERLSVAVTRLGAPGPGLDLADFRARLGAHASGVPVLAADPRARHDVERVVRAALDRATTPRTEQ
ncbi:hypothetical protein VV01_15650 [Luteipulveratus halotolerans]|uniref:GTP-binding protein n=1 Tax=Luteipulveratus halotolerans TaxID=1631356 RepID=A0A0L6CP69_9MICO|nr:hypothetical protein VV01_15650 [Luteipulveratus halotolerans]